MLVLLAVELEDRERLFGLRLRELTPGMVTYRVAVREAATAAGGNEWVSQSFADRRVFVFSRPSFALRAALRVIEAVRGIHTESGRWAVRCAVLAGEVEGPAEDAGADLVQRLRALVSHCPGNQVFANGSAVDLGRFSLGPAFAFRDLGGHALVSGGEPERVSMVLHPELESAEPPTLGAARPPGEVPVRSEFFFGRFDELEALQEMLERRRVVTLRGPGGVGKTALAQRVATLEAGNFSDGVRYVDMSRSARPSDPAGEVGIAIGKPSAGLESVLQELADREILLVLDGVDGAGDEVRKFIQAALRSCPRTRFLVTSRRALRLSGEAVFEVPPLALPEPRDGPSPEEAEQYDAVALFVDRVQARLPEFRVTPLNVRHVVAICKRLDGIPLAIELVASRADRLSLEQMLACLERTAPETTESLAMGPMEEALTWTTVQLEPTVREAFVRLSVLKGSWPLDIALKVGSGDGLSERQVDQAVQALVEASLLSREFVLGRGEQFRMLEIVRSHARSLETDPDRRRRHEERLGRTILGAFEAALERERAAIDRAASLVDCLQPSVEAAVDRGDLELARALVIQAFPTLWRFGHFVLGFDLAERLLSIVKNRAEYTTVRLLNMAGVFGGQIGKTERASRRLREAVALARRQGRTDAMPGLYGNLAELNRSAGRVREAATLYQSAIDLTREAGNRRVLGQLMLNRCVLFLDYGMLEEAGADLEQLANLPPSEDPYEVRRVRLIRARLLLASGALAEAEELALEGLQLAMQAEDEPNVLGAARTLAVRLAQLQDYAAATLTVSAVREGCIRLGTASFVGERDWVWLAETLQGTLSPEEVEDYEGRGATLDILGLGRYLMYRFGLELVT